MALSALDIQNKTFQKKKFGGFDQDEVDDFLTHVVRDYEELSQKNRELTKDLKHAKEKLGYFDELKDSLNESIIVAQDTANKVKANASNEADVIVKTAETKADQILILAKKKAEELLEEAANNAKNLAVETEDLKKKTRGFHQRLSLMLESQLQTVKTTEWDELLQPFSNSVEDHQEALKAIIQDVEKEQTAPSVEEAATPSGEPVGEPEEQAQSEETSEQSVPAQDSEASAE
ncbi:MAG: DivIVA domain-containing protein [Streptococcaceae bacterium]|jgi:cell division initiation protein|nr:DivIVA domain-containing protein [Streptococcaceae bacterium]